MINTKKPSVEYGKWIGSMEWDLYVVIRNENGTTKNMVHSISNTLYNKNKMNIERMVYIGERDKGCWNNYHINILVKTTNPTELIQKLKKQNHSKTFYVEPINSNLGVSNYIFKYTPTPLPKWNENPNRKSIYEFNSKFGTDLEWGILFTN